MHWLHAPGPLHCPEPIGVVLQLHAWSPLHEPVPTEAMLLIHAFVRSQEPEPTEPLLFWHANSPLQEFEPTGAELKPHASMSVQDPDPTAAELERHTSSPPVQDPGRPTFGQQFWLAGQQRPLFGEFVGLRIALYFRHAPPVKVLGQIDRYLISADVKAR
jgi:hypothetical protein